ncbi:MAG: LTA synthase family protein, partial [Bradymonadaceae bacterium]
MIPVTVLQLGLRVARVAARETDLGMLATVDVFLSDLLLLAGLTLVGLGLLGWARKGKRAVMSLVGLQIVVVVVTAVGVIAHRFYMSTGSTLGFHVLSYSISEFEDASSVIASEIPVRTMLLIATSAILALAGPWLATWLARKRADGEEDNTISGPRLGSVAVSGLLLVVASTFPPFVAPDIAFARAPVVNVTTTMFQGWNRVETDSEPVEYSAEDVKLAASGEGVDKKNVVVLIMESTRARAVTPYNSVTPGSGNDGEPITPYLDKLADKSLMAERAYTIVPHTSKALIPIFCGIEPRLNMPISEAVPNGIPARCLPEMLGDHGYESIFFQSATKVFENRPQMVENFGFDEFTPLEEMDKKGFAKANYFGREDNVMLKPSREWLEERTGDSKPFMAAYLTLTPHHHYLAPKTYGRYDFADKKMLNRYLNAVHYVDQFIKSVIKQYKELGLYEDTLFVIVGDHGEGFKEHGRTQHDNVIWEEGLRTPLLVHNPDKSDQGARRVGEPVSHRDIVPTIADILGYEIQNANLPGKSLLEVDEVRPLMSHCWYERRCMARIVGDKKYIHHFNNRSDQFFDLSQDPLEETNLAGRRSNLDQWKKKLFEWRTGIISLYRKHNREQLDEYIYESLPKIQHKTDAKFGDFARLLGYDLSKKSVKPGDEITITYYFEVLGNIPPKWKLFVHGEGDRILNLDHVPVNGRYPLQDWKSGEILADNHTIEVPDNWKSSTLDVHLGIYHPDEGRAKIEGSIPTDGNRRARVARIPVDRGPSVDRSKLGEAVSETAPEPDHKLDIQYGDLARMIGYDLSATTAAPGEKVDLTMYFKAERDIPVGWKLFMHGVTGSGLHNFDHVPVDGLYPVGQWRRGEYIKDTYTVRVPKGVSSGKLDLYVGLWHKSSKKRAPVTAETEVDEDRAKVAGIEIASFDPAVVGHHAVVGRQPKL